MNIKKYIKGGLNSDVNPSLVPDGDYLNALNIRGQVGDDGKAGVIRPVPGHTKAATIADDLAEFTGTSSQDIKHMCVDEVNGYVYAFISGTASFDPGLPPPLDGVVNKSPRIVRINLRDNTVQNVISASKVLWFPNNFAYGWEDFVEAKVVGDTLVWINKYGYQFSLNVEAYRNKLSIIDLNPYTDKGADIDFRDISLTKAPPCINLFAVKAVDSSYQGKNFIRDNIFQFAYRYVYDGDEITVLSPLSNEVPINAQLDDFNCVDINFGNGEIIPSMVKRIDLICKNAITGSIFVIKSFRDTDTNPSNPLQLIFDAMNDGSYVHRFYNNQIYEAVDLAYATKQFDAVPVSSYALEVSKDRVFLSNNTEGYDTPSACNLEISVGTTNPALAIRDYQIYYIRQTVNVPAGPPAPTVNYIGSYAVYIEDAPNPGWYELNVDDGYYSDPGTPTVGICSISSITQTLVAAEFKYTFSLTKTGDPYSAFGITAGAFLDISGFLNSANNGLFYVDSVQSPNTIRLRSLKNVSPVVESIGSIKMAVKTIAIGASPTVPPRLPNPVVTPINISELMYVGPSMTSYSAIHKPIAFYVMSGEIPVSPPGSRTIVPATETKTALEAKIVVVGSSQSRSFKSGSRYSVGIQYYDFALRKCGVFTKESLNISTPERNYGTTNLNSSIDWSLPNTPDINIPLWAAYYSIVRTDNLDTRYFIQGFTRFIGTGKSQITYVTTNTSSGLYNIADTNLVYGPTVTAIAIDIESILNDAFGYIYEESNNDIVNLIQNTANGTRKQSLKVITQQGRYIILEPKDLGTFSDINKSWIYEIVRPYINTDAEPFYETQIYEIIDWGTNNRRYSQSSGALTGDKFQQDGLEYMNLRSEFRNFWSRNLGRPCFIDPIGQVYRPNGVRWSNVFIPGSKINGLSTFDALDYKDLPVELGPINKLKTTSKAQSEGNVMLAIGQNYTASMYIGETSLVDNAGQSLLTTSGAVVGTVNVLRGRFGTTLPASVVEYDGNVYWADILNECIVRYSANGLFAISDYGLRNFFRSYFKTKKTEVDEYNITQSPYIYGGYNPATDEYILSFVPVSQSPDQYPDSSGSRLSDIKIMYKSGTPAKSIAFSLSQERWTSFYSHSGPYVYFGGKMYSFVKSTYLIPGVSVRYSGGLFVFDKDSAINNFSGTVRNSFISIPYNDAPSNTKIFHAVSIEGTTAPSTTYVETFIPNNQITSLISSDFKNREDVFYSELYRDRVSPNASGTADEKMYTGDKIRGQYANISTVWSNPSNFEIRFINVNVKDSIGHNKLSQ